MLALHTRRELGAARIIETLDAVGDRYADADDLAGALSERRPKRDAARFGWTKDGEADSDYQYIRD